MKTDNQDLNIKHEQPRPVGDLETADLESNGFESELKVSDHTNILIKASAGSGKTFQLSNRYIELILGGVSPDTILATTFTRKAAGEIMERVLRRLADAALDENAFLELSKHISPKLNKQLSQEMINGALTKLAKNIHRVRISTLDSFFQQIAGAFNLELGMPPNWTIMEPEAEEPLLGEAVRTLLEQGEKTKILQLVHFLFKGESHVPIAREITSITRDLIEIYNNSTAKAWDNIIRHTEPTADEIRFLAKRLSQAEIGENKNGSPNQTMLKARNKDLLAFSVEDVSQIDWLGFVTSGIGSKVAQGAHDYSRKPLPDSLYQVYHEIVTHVRTFVLNDLANRTVSRRDLLQMVSGFIENLKRQSRQFTFSDMTERLADSEINQDHNRIAHRTDFQTRHLLLDEFQDTSSAQWRILKPLAERIFANQDKKGSFFCVGDVKQAIYGWRGGVAAIFDLIEDDFPSLQKQHLEKSFRSSQIVMDMVNTLFENIASNGALGDFDVVAERFQDRFQTHSTAKTSLPGCSTLETSRFAEPRLTAEGTVDPESVPNKADHDKAHIEYVVERIIEIHKRSPGAKIGVLTRTNKMIQKIIMLLRQRGIPASEEGGNSLAISPAVEVILSALTLADHPGDRVALFHLANSPLASSLDLDLSALDRQDKVETISCQIRSRLLYEGYVNVLQDWVRVLAPHCDSRDFRKLVQLLELAGVYQSEQTIRTRPFVELVRNRKIEDPAAAKICVMSIHRSKGLEFDIVILPELDDSLKGRPPKVIAHRKKVMEKYSTVFVYPDEDRQKVLPEDLLNMVLVQSDEKVEESLCLLYVAMTRAIHELVMILSPQKPAANDKTGFPKTMAGVLQAAFAPNLPRDMEILLYRHGDQKWYLDPEAPPHIMLGTTPEETALPEKELIVSLASQRKSARRNLARVTPSEQEGEDDSAEVVDKFLVDEILFSGSARQAMNRGTAIHACFEKVGWLDQKKLDFEEALQIVSPFIAKPTERERIVREFFEMCEKSEILELLSYENTISRMSQADSAWVFNERRFLVRLDAETLQQGSIDRLVVFMKGGQPVGAEIIDFKTDRLPNEEQAIAERTDFYRPQIKAYRHAVSKMYQLDSSRISSRILFTSNARIINVFED